MGFSLKKFLEESSAQLNPFDGGKTAQTVRQQRATTPPPTVAKPKQSFGNKIRDQFDANTEADKFRRSQAGKPVRYQDEVAQRRGIPRLYGNFQVKNQNDIGQLRNAFRTGESKAGALTEVGINRGLIAPIPNLLSKLQNRSNTYNSAANKFASPIVDAVAPQNISANVQQLTGTAVLARNPRSQIGRNLEAGARISAQPGDEYRQYADNLKGNRYLDTGASVAGNIVRNANLPGQVLSGVDTAGRTTRVARDNNVSPTKSIVGGAGAGLIDFGLNRVSSQALLGKTKLGKTPIGRIGTSALASGVENSAQQLGQNLLAQRTYDPTRGSFAGVKDAGVAGTLFGAGGRLLGEVSNPTTRGQLVDQTQPVAARNRELIQQYQRAFDVETNPVRRRQISQAIAELNQMSQGGYVDPKAMGDDIKKLIQPKADVSAPIAEPQVKRVAQADPADLALKTDATLASNGGKPTDVVPPIKNAEPPTKKTKYASKTVPESEFVSEQVRKSVQENAPTYEVQNERARYTSSVGRVKEQGLDDFTNDLTSRLETKNGTIDAQTVADGQTAAAMLDAQGDPVSLQKATEIYERLSEHLTAAGQTVQAASILSRRTPEGLQYGAIKTLKKAGVEITPKLQQELKSLTDRVRANPDDLLARHKVAEFVSKNTPSSFADKAINLWKAGLLTSPRTTAGNLAANAAETIFSKGYVDPVANVVDSFMSLFTGKRSRSLTGKGLASGAKEGTIRGVNYFKTGYDPRNPIEKFDIKSIHYSDTPLGRAAEKYTQGVFRLMGAQDQPFYYANQRNSLYDQAITEAKNLGLKGTQRDTYIKKFVTEPSQKALELADKEAKYAVFQNDTALGKAASKIKNMDGAAGKVADFVIPFSGVPSSVATRMVERTPIGTAAEIVKQLKSKNFDQRAMSKAIANGSAIIPLVGAGFALSENGQMTLGYPSDKKERDLWEAEGKQPYSIKIGDTWLSTNYFQPAGNLLAAGAEYQAKKKETGSDQEALTTSVAGATKALTEQSFLQGVSGVLNAVNDPSRFGQKFLEQTAGSVVPNFIRTAARATDEYARDSKGIVDSVKAGIPGLRQTIDARNNMFGAPVERRSSPGNEVLNPLKPSDIKNQNDDTLKEVRRLQDAQNGVTTPEIKKDSLGDDTVLTKEQVNEMERTIKPEIKKAWDTIIKDPRYAKLSDEDKSKVLKDASDTIYKAGKQQFQVSYGSGKLDKLSKKERSVYEGNQVDFIKPRAEQSAQVSYESLDSKLQDFLIERDGSTSDDWKAAAPESESAKDLIRRVSLIKPDGLPDLPQNNRTAELYAEFAQKRAKEKWTPTYENSQKKALLRDIYRTQLSDDDNLWYKASDSVIQDALDNGEIAREQLAKLVALDDLLVQLGGSAQMGKALRRNNGFGLAPSGRTSSRSGGTKGSSGSKRISDSVFNLMDMSSTRSSNRNALRKILNSAKL